MYFYTINDKKEIETYEMTPNKDKIMNFIKDTMTAIPVENQGLLHAKTSDDLNFLYEDRNYFVYKYRLNFGNEKRFHYIDYYPKTKENMILYEEEVKKYCDGLYSENYIVYVDKSNKRTERIFDRCFLFIDNYKYDNESWYSNKIIEIPEKLFWLDALIHNDFYRFNEINNDEMAKELLSLFNFIPVLNPIKIDDAVYSIYNNLVEANLMSYTIKEELDEKIKSTSKYLKLVKKS